MAAGSDPRFLVLHALRLKGVAELDAIVLATRLPADAVRRAVDELRDSGLVARREGRLAGFLLSPAGRRHHAQRIAAELAGTDRRTRVERCYERFLPLNRVLLGVCTDWQLRRVGGRAVLNDHRDARYDERVLARLEAVDREAQPLCGDLASALGRFSPYPARLRDALQHTRAGERDWFTGPEVDSYHTVWFELHEDLLLTLGIERAKEEA